MAAKQLQFDENARHALLRGIEKLSNAVKATLGPSGRNVILDKKFGSPTITKDGVTVAKEIELEDPYENMGAQLVREVASKTSDIAGDGTTTATVLAEAIYKEGLRNVTAGANPTSLQRGINKAVEAVVAELAKISKKVSDRTEIAQVATVSANWDTHDRRDHCRRDGQGRQGRNDHGGRSQVDRNQPRRGRRHAVRQGLPLSLLRHQRRSDGSGPRQPLHPHSREENLELEGHAAAARESRESRTSVAHHRGRRGRRSARDPGREQAPRHAASGSRQGSGIRRSSQGDAGRPRGPHRRSMHHRRPRHQTRERKARGLRACQARHD